MTVKDRLIKLANVTSKSIRDFEQKCSLGNGFMNKSNGNITSDKVKSIVKVFPNLNLDWLIMGDGDMFKDKANGIAAKKDIASIPFYASLPVSGGAIMQYQDIKTCETEDSINLPFTKSAEFSFPVIGCSMQPTIKEGDIVGVVHIDGFESCNPDRIYVIITRDNERMIKRINRYDREKGCIWLVSDNPQYEPFPIYTDNIVDVYKVVWRISFDTM